VFYKITKKKDGTEKKNESGWDGKLVPKALVIEMFFSAEQKAVEEAEIVVEGKQAELDELLEIDEALEEHEVPQDIAISILKKEIKEKTKLIKDLKAVLDQKVRDQYDKLTNDQCLKLLLECKWYRSLRSGVFALYSAVNHRMAGRVTELAERYERTLPMLESDVTKLEKRVGSHLKRMGFEW
jgi:type I restriction enzyme M protein